MNDLGDQRQRLQGPRAELLQQQPFGEFTEIALGCDGEHRAETLPVDMHPIHVMMIWNGPANA